MRIARFLLAAGTAAAASVAVAQPANISTMRWHRRILLVSAPDPASAQAASQRRIFAAWQREAGERDLTLVEVAGAAVSGVADSAGTLRRRYRLPAEGFAVLLIGKDGHVALRSTQPINAETLEHTIDSMPMRRAGQR